MPSGVAISRRRCDNPKPLNTELRCPGPDSNTQFCEDGGLCPYRLSVTQYASQKCRELSQIVKDIRPDGEGTQVPHSDSECRRRAFGGGKIPVIATPKDCGSYTNAGKEFKPILFMSFQLLC